jgi:mRNA-degrading endonuclease toxin of MazEF toxin-antitoxin module
MKRTDRRRCRQSDHRHHRDNERRARELRGTQAVSGRRLVVGTVVLVDVPYRDGTGSKQRPAVIVGRDGDRLVVRPFTTSEPRDTRGFIEVEPTWKNGLTRRSWLRPDTCVVSGDAIRAVRGRCDITIDLTEHEDPAGV